MKLIVLYDRTLEKPIAGQRLVEQFSAETNTNGRTNALFGGGFLLAIAFVSRVHRTRTANV
jgi:hypothetical protein